MEPFAYQGSSRPEVHGCLPRQAARVLDVGCNDGSFGSFLRGRYPDAVIWGVEPNADQAEQAAKRLDRVFVEYFDPGVPELTDTALGFDLITFNHVLEHIYDPWEVLAKTRDLLRRDGVVAAVIPNIRYAPFLVSLAARGRWEYQDSGLLDRTHVRFFTRSSIVQLFSSAGFKIDKMEPVNAMGEVRFKRSSKAVSRLLGDLTYGGFAVRASSSH